MDFIALDIETANSDLASICSVGLVHFRNGEPFKTFSFLVDPEDSFDFMNISIHGIEPDDVAGKSTMREIFPMISSTLSSFVIAHHTAFDRVAFARAAAKYGFPELQFNWLDTARVARRAWERFAYGGYGLENLAREFDIDFRHHEAAEDARAAGLILLQAMAETGLTIEEWFERAIAASGETNHTRHRRQSGWAAGGRCDRFHRCPPNPANRSRPPRPGSWLRRSQQRDQCNHNPGDRRSGRS